MWDDQSTGIVFGVAQVSSFWRKDGYDNILCIWLIKVWSDHLKPPCGLASFPFPVTLGSKSRSCSTASLKVNICNSFLLQTSRTGWTICLRFFPWDPKPWVLKHLSLVIPTIASWHVPPESFKEKKYFCLKPEPVRFLFIISLSVHCFRLPFWCGEQSEEMMRRVWKKRSWSIF